MKQKLLFGIYFYFLLLASSVDAQVIKFERVLPPPPASQITPNLKAVGEKFHCFSDIDGDGDQDVLMAG
jgi:hypothetical protein